jgi:hypothetical protein
MVAQTLAPPAGNVGKVGYGLGRNFRTLLPHLPPKCRAGGPRRRLNASGDRVNNDDWRAADAVIPVGEGPYCAVLVAAADVVVTFGLMTSVADGGESGARTMTVLGEVRGTSTIWRPDPLAAVARGGRSRIRTAGATVG